MSDTAAKPKEQGGSDSVNYGDPEKRDRDTDTGARPKEQRGQGRVKCGYQEKIDTRIDKGATPNEKSGPGMVKGEYQVRTYTRIPSMDKGDRLKEQRGSDKVHEHRYRTSADMKHPSIQVSSTEAAIRHMSVRLNDVLDKVGASAEFRKLRHDCAISREIINTLYSQLQYRQLCSCYIFGSSSEGSTTPGMNSDTDLLLCHDEYPVLDTISDAGDGHSFVMIRDKHTQPGYVKLQRVYNGQPQTVYTRDIYRDTEESDKEGRICIKHVSGLGCVNKRVDERNGPADTYIEDNVDNVIGHRCSKIPEFCAEWIGRKRQYKWPSKRMIDKMSTMGCFVVGVGHPTSIERNIEWRLSFSLQEREMMFSMNIVQHKCYIVLKMIKKDLIEPIVGKSITRLPIAQPTL